MKASAFRSVLSRITLTPDPRLMRLVYFDCAGSNRKEPFCVVVAVIVHEDHWTWLDHYSRSALIPLWTSRAQMTKKARELMKQGKFEFHGHELFNGKGPWPRNAKAKKFRFDLLSGFLDVPNKVQELGIQVTLPIVYGATYTPELIRRYGADAWDAEEIAFILCMEQVERFFTKTCDKEKGLLLGDRNVKTEFAIRNLGDYMRRQSAPIGRNPDSLTHMIETVHFADSQSTSGIQLADVCAFVIKRHLMNPDDLEVGKFFHQIAPHIKFARVW